MRLELCWRWALVVLPCLATTLVGKHDVAPVQLTAPPSHLPMKTGEVPLSLVLGFVFTTDSVL